MTKNCNNGRNNNNNGHGGEQEMRSGCRLRITATNPGALHVTTKQIVSSALNGEENGKESTCSCACPNLIEVNLRIRACQCKDKRTARDSRRINGIADKICECLNRSNSKSNFLKIDFVDGHLSDPEDCPNGEKRRNVLVLKLQDLDVKCENGLRHELYFPAASVVGKALSPGDCLAYSLSSTGDIQEHKPIPVPEEIKTPAEPEKAATAAGRQKRAPVERQISKSMDDVKPKRDKRPTKSSSAQNVAEKGSAVGGPTSDDADNSMSDMDSIELIIISDEFLNESQNQEIIIVNEQRPRRISPTRSKSFQIKKSFLHDTKATGTTTNGKDRGDYFKRAAEAKAKAAAAQQSNAAAATAGKRLVIISDEFKRKSQENTVRIVKSKEKPVQQHKSLLGLAKSKTISNAMVDLNSKIISCVLQSYEEPERLENKALEEQLARKARGCPAAATAVPIKSVTPKK